MGLGALFGRWRIGHTMGSKITRLYPMKGFCAECVGAPASTRRTDTGPTVRAIARIVYTPMAGLIGAGADARRAI